MGVYNYMNDIIFYGGGAYIILYLWLLNSGLLGEHGNQHTKSDKCANEPFPMVKQKTPKNINNSNY